MAAADDGLVGIVGIHVEAAAREDAGEDVTGAGNALAVFTTNANCEINFSHAQILSALKSFCVPHRDKKTTAAFYAPESRSARLLIACFELLLLAFVLALVHGKGCLD